MHSFLNELHPGVAFVLRAGQNLHHLWDLNACCDEEEATLLVSNLPDDQLLEGDDCGPLVLEGKERGEGGIDGDEKGGQRKKWRRQWEGQGRKEEEGRHIVKKGRGWERQEGRREGLKQKRKYGVIIRWEEESRGIKAGEKVQQDDKKEGQREKRRIIRRRARG